MSRNEKKRLIKAATETTAAQAAPASVMASESSSSAMEVEDDHAPVKAAASPTKSPKKGKQPRSLAQQQETEEPAESLDADDPRAKPASASSSLDKKDGKHAEGDKKVEVAAGDNKEDEERFFLKAKDVTETDPKKLPWITRKMLQKSGLLKTMAEGDKDERTFTLDLPTKTLNKMLEYLRHLDGTEPTPIQRPLKSKNFAECVEDEWIVEWLEVSKDEMCDMLEGSNYMGIISATFFCAGKINSTIKGKTVDQIREIWGIKNDFTPEEEEAIRAENKFARE